MTSLYRPVEERSPTSFLNDLNPSQVLAESSSADVVVVGAGIHSLIYAIHSRKHSNESTRVTVLERSPTPSYKIGESTLTVFGLWLKTIGIDPPILWRLFGPKDGLAFYYLERDGDPEQYTNFCANGPPGDFVATLQIERTVSELLLTLIAQRMGVDVWHGHEVAIDATTLKAGESIVRVTEKATGAPKDIHCRLVVDATGRFRRLASKEARLKRMMGWNTDAFWAYFDMPEDESQIPLKYFESCNTNHICLAEGQVVFICYFSKIAHTHVYQLGLDNSPPFMGGFLCSKSSQNDKLPPRSQRCQNSCRPNPLVVRARQNV